MECTIVQEQLSAFIDGEADSASEPNLFSHLAGCGRCCEFFRDAQAVRSDILRSKPLRAPAGLDRRVLGAAAPGLSPHQTAFSWYHRALHARLSLPVPVAATIAILLIATVLSLVRGPSRGTLLPPPIREVVYVMTLPAVNVEAQYPVTRKSIQ